jgi:hypothetical protein
LKKYLFSIMASSTFYVHINRAQNLPCLHILANTFLIFVLLVFLRQDLIVWCSPGWPRTFFLWYWGLNLGHTP